MKRSLVLAFVLAAGCASAPPHEEHAYHECAFCGELGPELVVWEYEEKPFKSCAGCRTRFDLLIEVRKLAMLDQVKTYRCDGCGTVQTIPAEEPASSCCGHIMRRLH